jgi:DNA-directed RNA polymerase subunit RPC12/RpoP
MDIVFKCPNCDQELEVDAGGAGSTIECPSCSNTITVPAAGSENATPAPEPPPAPTTIASFHEKLHLSVPAHDTPSEALIKKPNRPLDVVAKEGDKKMRIRTFKRSDCQEVGKDKFDEKVSEFLDHVGQANVISINTVSYSMVDMSTKALLQDYGVLIVFKG